MFRSLVAHNMALTATMRSIWSLIENHMYILFRFMCYKMVSNIGQISNTFSKYWDRCRRPFTWWTVPQERTWKQKALKKYIKKNKKKKTTLDGWGCQLALNHIQEGKWLTASYWTQWLKGSETLTWSHRHHRDRWQDISPILQTRRPSLNRYQLCNHRDCVHAGWQWEVIN